MTNLECYRLTLGNLAEAEKYGTVAEEDAILADLDTIWYSATPAERQEMKEMRA
jgi:hypothetical protein